MACGVSSWCVSLPALAHPSAAEPPVFEDSACVLVADKRAQEYLDIRYNVLMDDTAIEAGDIPVADAKTHQFFALAGTVYQVGTDDVLAPFADPMGQGVGLPLWITHSDVQRAAAASSMDSGVTEDQTDLPPERVLETRPELAGQWLRITADDARRPITATQSLIPVRWDLREVPAGVYTVAGYVFSPPYNAWAPRSGVVKVVDEGFDPPAGALEPINDVVFSYQGRSIKACLDVPAGTKLDAYYFVEESPSLGWLPWLTDAPAETGALNLCFHADAEGVVGSVRIRVDLRAADGSVTTSMLSKDTLTWLQGSGVCEESDLHCCDFEGARDAAASAAVDAAVDAAIDGSVPNESTADAGAVDLASAGAPVSEDPSAPAGGCSLTTGPRRADGRWLLGVAAGLGLWRRRRRRCPLLSGAHQV